MGPALERAVVLGSVGGVLGFVLSQAAAEAAFLVPIALGLAVGLLDWVRGDDVRVAECRRRL